MRKVISTDKAPKAIGPYSQAIEASGLLFCSGQVGFDPSTMELVNGLEAQTQRALENLREVLSAAGLSCGDVVKTTVFLTSMDDFATMNDIYAKFFTESPPARSTVAVKELPKGALVEVEATALFH